jgi:transcriptional regulator with XRE-family HTH domain
MTIPTHASSTHLEALPAVDSAAVRAYLREVRHDRGLSLEALAQRAGTPPVALAGALWGELPLSPEAAGRLATVLHVDPALVACVAEPENPPLRLPLLGDAPSDCGGQGRPAVVAKEGSD